MKLPSRADSTTRTVVAAALGVVLILAGMAVVMLRGGPSPDRFATSDNTVETTTTTTIIEAPVFLAAPSSSTPPTVAPATTAPPTTRRTTTTIAPTTTVEPTTTTPETLPKQQTTPVAPPPDPRGYEDEVQLGGISIPALGIDDRLFEGIRLTTLDKGPGHWPGTAMPGEIGNVVVAAHRTSHSAPFRNIDKLVPGDKVNFTTEAGVIEYTVTGTQIVTPDAMWIVNPTDTPTATLFACHPPGSVSHRIVVNLELS